MSSLISQPRPMEAVNRPPFVQEMFCQMAKQNPQAVAIEGPKGSLNYGELDERSSRIAAALRSVGTQKSDLVGIFTQDRQFMIECELGILKAGAAFVPPSPQLPTERLDSMLAECAPKWALVTEDVKEKFSLLAASQSIQIVPFSSGSRETACEPVEMDGDDLSYIFFTSGSTGTPKGIAGRLKGVDH